MDLTPQQQERISVLSRDLHALSLYDLLGVPRLADKKEIKRAYHARASELHPDRFFRKRLGSFKPKLEAIFARMTEAHDVLCSPERRALHDAALDANRSCLIEAMLEEAADEMAGSALAARREECAVDEGLTVETTTPSAPPSPTSVPPVAATAADIQARREALARRLLSGRRPSTMVPANQAASPESSAGRLPSASAAPAGKPAT